MFSGQLCAINGWWTNNADDDDDDGEVNNMGKTCMPYAWHQDHELKHTECHDQQRDHGLLP
jgi:hypothetical protein